MSKPSPVPCSLKRMPTEDHYDVLAGLQLAFDLEQLCLRYAILALEELPDESAPEPEDSVSPDLVQVAQ